ncbi:MAG: flagellar biosynthesis protein FlgA [Deltaproteobacteria bacterium]|nr:MAG: flagellar biosynthesis protein FlgA [Deltaproteobacteria bacterium]RLB95566.1 MAG: flagellar biosynthesis protein FlgA [Deltaproteobacteria bacterium]RLC11851.1 MAG: flagellar biosynthesis protein FlgA [Deltaproteobacteria bacterium]
MCRLIKIIFVFVLVLAACPVGVYGARVKDIASIKGIRNNQLVGYGLVVGLKGTGDKTGTSFTIQSLANMIERMGIHVDKEDVSVKNVAAVMVTASVPPFARIGNRIDVVVSSVGDAKSLQGGTLLLTPLYGVDKKIYALAQGPVSVGGFAAGGAAGGGITKNHPTVGRISRGASIEREIPVSMQDKDEIVIALDNPDFTTAVRLCDAINERFGRNVATTVDSGTLKLKIPEDFRQDVVQMVATVENLEVMPDSIAKVVLNEKTGTVVIGENVTISTVAVAHGNLSIQIKERTRVSQPSPFAPAPPAGATTQQFQPENGLLMGPGGQTVVSADSDVSVQEEKNKLLLVPRGSTIGELVRALNAIGVSPRDLITVFQALRAAGALHAQIEII